MTLFDLLEAPEGDYGSRTHTEWLGTSTSPKAKPWAKGILMKFGFYHHQTPPHTKEFSDCFQGIYEGQFWNTTCIFRQS